MKIVNNIISWISKRIPNATAMISRNKATIIRALCVAIAVFFICLLLFDIAFKNSQNQDLINEISERPIPTPALTPVPSPSPTPKPEDSPPTPEPIPLKPRKPNERDINFEELREVNPDVIGWIEVPGTNIDYPFVSTLDNYYYLDRDLFGNRSIQGTIFADIRNNPDMEDPFIVLYGHNMKDGSKFANLHRFRNETFFNENNKVIIYTPEGQLEYRIFAAYERNDEHLMGTKNFRNPAIMKEYILEIPDIARPGAILDLDDITETDSILTLSTCTGNDVIRFLVQAVFVAP